MLGIAEIDADERIVAGVVFDLDDVDAAFEELDARYLAGEAAAHAQTWSVIARAYAALNRHELPATTPDWVIIDHAGSRWPSKQAIWPHSSVPCGNSRPTSASTSRPFIG